MNERIRSLPSLAFCAVYRYCEVSWKLSQLQQVLLLLFPLVCLSLNEFLLRNCSIAICSMTPSVSLALFYCEGARSVQASHKIAPETRSVRQKSSGTTVRFSANTVRRKPFCSLFGDRFLHGAAHMLFSKKCSTFPQLL